MGDASPDSHKDGNCDAPEKYTLINGSVKDEIHHGEKTQDVAVSQENASRGGTAVPPDGGWGWMVVLASFTISLLVDGVCFSFGIFFDEFRFQFNASKAEASWIGSVLNGTYLIFGPVFSAMVSFFGCRKVTIFGAVLASVALFICTFSPSIGLLIFTYGFLGGLGFGFMYLPAIVMVGYYFERRRALATGIACCGSGIGAFVFAPFTEYLLQEFGWKGAHWILSALLLNGLICAIFFRPLLPSLPSSTSSLTSSPLSSSAGKGEKDTSRLLSATEKEIESINTKDASSTINPDLKIQILQSLNSDPNPIYRTRSMTMQNPQVVKESSRNAANVARLAFSQDFALHYRKGTSDQHRDFIHRAGVPPLQRKDIFYSGSVWHLKEFKEMESVDEYRLKVTENTPHSPANPDSTKNSFIQSVIGVFDFSLLRSPTFLIYGTSCFLCMAGFFVPFIYMPTHAIDLGFDSTSAAILISVIGITNTFCRVAVGFVSDKDWADCLLINNVSLIVGGVATIFVPYYTQYYLLAVYSVIFGHAIAVFVSLRSIIMVELMGLDKLTTAFGLVIMCQGMSSFLGAPLAGAISDYTGNYDAAFYMAGVTLTLSGVICLPLRRVSQWETRKNASKGSSSSKKNQTPDQFKGRELDAVCTDQS